MRPTTPLLVAADPPHRAVTAALTTLGSYEAYDYEPYGVPTLTADSSGLGTVENPYGFSTGIQDRNTGWVQYGQRYYDPNTGAWTQLDTLDTPLDPANANRYAYAGGDPINNIDPTGRKGGEDCVAGLIGYAGATLAFGSALVDGPVGIAVGAGVISIAAGEFSIYECLPS